MACPADLQALCQPVAEPSTIEAEVPHLVGIDVREPDRSAVVAIAASRGVELQLDLVVEVTRGTGKRPTALGMLKGTPFPQPHSCLAKLEQPTRCQSLLRVLAQSHDEGDQVRAVTARRHH